MLYSKCTALPSTPSGALSVAFNFNVLTSNTSTAEFKAASGFKVLSTHKFLDFGCDFTNNAPPPVPVALISFTTVHCPSPGLVLIKDNLFSPK